MTDKLVGATAALTTHRERKAPSSIPNKVPCAALPRRAGKVGPIVRAIDRASAREKQRRRADELDELDASWRSALDAAQTALQAASGTVPAQALRPQTIRLRNERAATAHVLEQLSRDWHLDRWFSDLQVPSGNLRRLLGLTPSVSACVFNLDGVLIGSAVIHAAAWADTFNEFISARVERTGGRFVAFDSRLDYYTHLHGRPRLDGVRAFLASRGVSLPEGDPNDEPGRETVHGLANRKQAALLRRLENIDLSAFVGSRRYLQLCGDAGLRRAVVSASANTRTILARAGLTTLIEARVDGNTMVADQLQGKPAPDTLLAACRRMGVEPAHAAAFETSSSGVTAARAAGFALVVGIGESFPAHAHNGHGPDIAGSSLNELLERRLATAG